MSNLHAQAKSIFLESIELDADDERRKLVAEKCGNDDSLRREVERLLGHEEAAEQFLESPPLDALAGELIDSEQPTKIGPYVIREQIGEGGMGVVYVAEQTGPVQRKVALKIIKPGMDTKEVIARFEAERQALAFMEHPNIARVLDAGATDSGRSYFVMELVRGIPITEYCDQVKATPRERLELFQSVCDAVQHAHQKGIIHRDIKPSNVLVTQVGAKPVVKVIDFGLAKAISGQRLTEKTLYTGFMKLMGTPAYMSPEQAGLSGLDVDTRSDIYSLGVLLYELLTGTTPLDKTEIQSQAYDELCRQIREVEAPKPSTRFSTLKDAERTTVAQLRQVEQNSLRHLLNGDLDRVVLKAIEKDRDRRYASPQDLAADIQRFLDDKPVHAVPPSQWYLARKYMRRHKSIILIAVAFLSFLLMASAFSTWQAIIATAARNTSEEKTLAAERSERNALKLKREADDARKAAVASEQRAEKAAEERRRFLYASNMQLADQLWHTKTATPVEIQELLAAWIPTNDILDDLREFAWRYQWSRLHFSAEQTVVDVKNAALSPTGNLIVADHDGIREWDNNRKRFSDRWQADTESQTIELSPCGRWAAVCSDESVQLVNISAGAIAHTVSGNGARFSPDGEYALIWHQPSRGDKSSEFVIWTLSSGESMLLPHVEGATQKAGSLSPDAKSILFQSTDHPGLLSAFLDGQTNRVTWRTRGEVECSDWAPNGELIASGHFAGDLVLRFADGSDEALYVSTQRNAISALAFSHDSTRLAVASDEGTVDFYDVSQFRRDVPDSAEQPSENASEEDSAPAQLSRGIESFGQPRLIRTLNAHVSRIDRIVFSQDDAKIVTCDRDGTAKLWLFDESSNMLPASEISEFRYCGTGLSFGDASDGVEVTNVSAALKAIEGQIQIGDRILAVSDDNGEHLVGAATDAGDVDRWSDGPHKSHVDYRLIDVMTGSESSARLERTREPGQAFYTSISFHEGAGIILTTSDCAFCRSQDGQVIRTFSDIRGANSSAVSSDGRVLAFDDDKDLVLWDTQKNELRVRLKSLGTLHSGFLNNMGGNVCFSPDGQFVAIGTGFRLNASPNSRQAELHVWNVSSLEKVASPLMDHNRCICGVVFTPDSRTLCATDNKGVIRLWNTSTWELENTTSGLFDANSIDISADGRWLAQGGFQGIVIWDLNTLEKRHVIRGKSVTRIRFSPDGKTLAITRVDGNVQFRDAVSGQPLATMDTSAGVLPDCDFSNDGRLLVVLGVTGELWRMEAEPIELLDQHPLTIDALSKKGMSQLQDEQTDNAENTLRHVLKLQRRTLTEGHQDIEATRDQLLKLLRSQGKCPDITVHPQSQRVALGADVKLFLECSDMNQESYDYQWFFSGQAIPNATQSTLTIEDVDLSRLGPYHVEAYCDPDLRLVIKSDTAFLVDEANPVAKGLRKEFFENIQGTKIADLRGSSKFPDHPDALCAVSNFESSTFATDNYGVRLTGFIVPPKTGEYIFYLCSDDNSELFLSTDASPQNKVSIARENEWHGARQWETLNADCISKPILLEAGKRYWVEAHHKEGRSVDHLAVTWQMPDHPPPKNGDPPIPGEYLEFHIE